VLGNLTDQPGFDYISAEEVLSELKDVCDKAVKPVPMASAWPKTMIPTAIDGLECITFWPIYRIDAMTRRSDALQQSATAESPCVWIHPHLAETLKLCEGELARVNLQGEWIDLPVRLSPRISVDSVYIPAGFAETAHGHAFGAVRVERSLTPC
jgi:NADH-quinone oxidoreductase subunit G